MFRAKDTFWAPDNRRIVKGDLVAPDDPVVDGREVLFEAVVIPQAVQPQKKAARGRQAPAKAETTQEPQGDGNDGDTGAQTPASDDDSTAQGDDADKAPAAEAKPAARKTAATKGGATS